MAFTEQFQDNVETRASIRTLEVLTQNEKEGFTAFLTRWRAISTEISPRPSETELISKFIYNLRPQYRDQMKYAVIENFRQLKMVGTRIEDDLRADKMSRVLSHYSNKGLTSSPFSSYEEDRYTAEDP